MKLAEAKRRIKVGMVIEAVGHFRPQASGPRIVTKVQGNGFYYNRPDTAVRQWCEWPKASLTVSDGPDSITIMIDAERKLTTLNFPEEANLW